MLRRISWINAARKEFEQFPKYVQSQMAVALQIAAEGELADISKPMKGLGSGIFEIALPYRRDAYRAIYAVKVGAEIWVLDAFKKKSKQGTRTPKADVDRVKRRLKVLQERLK